MNVDLLLNGIFSGEQLVPLAVMAVASMLLLSSLRRRQRQRQRQPSPAEHASPLRSPPPQNPPGDSERIRRDLESLLIELQELSRKISAQIDMRFAKLEAAIRDADRRIATLTRLSKAPKKKAAGKPSRPGEEDLRHTVVYDLADTGMTSIQVARELGKTPGEIELILNLRRQMEKSPPPPTPPA